MFKTAAEELIECATRAYHHRTRAGQLAGSPEAEGHARLADMFHKEGTRYANSIGTRRERLQKLMGYEPPERPQN